MGYKIVRALLNFIFFSLFGLHVEGRENVPSTGAVIVAPNHKSDWDPPLIGVAFNTRIIHYMAKEEYFEGNMAWFYKFVGCIKVDRRIHDETAKSEALDVLRSGGALGIFPEGTRNKTFGTKDEVVMLPFKFGAVSLAQKTNALIVPFGISGKYTRDGNLTTRIGKPFSVNDMSLEDANKLLRKKILKLMQKSE